MVRAGEKAGADLILLETFSDTLEIKAALLAAKENSKLPVAATMIFDAQGKLLTGADIPGVVALLEGLGADAKMCIRDSYSSSYSSIFLFIFYCYYIPVIFLRFRILWISFL